MWRILKGKFKFLKRIEGPWKVHYFIEKYDRMRWHAAIIDRKVPDFCKALNAVKEPWYDFTRQFKQKDCPYEAGHVEVFENAAVARNLGPIPFPLIGKYRASVVSYFTDENGAEVKDCARAGFDILEA